MDANTTQLLFFGVIIVVIIALMFRNGRKRQRTAAEMTSGLRPGAEIMTSGGIFGTITAIDEDENKITLRTGPTSEITIHRQAIGKIVTPVADDGTVLNGEPVVLEDAAADPAFGERVDLSKREPGTVRPSDSAASKGAGE